MIFGRTVHFDDLTSISITRKTKLGKSRWKTAQKREKIKEGGEKRPTQLFSSGQFKSLISHKKRD